MNQFIAEELRARCSGNKLADGAMAGFLVALEDQFPGHTGMSAQHETLLVRGALQSVIDRFEDAHTALRYAPKKG